MILKIKLPYWITQEPGSSIRTFLTSGYEIISTEETCDQYLPLIEQVPLPVINETKSLLGNQYFHQSNQMADISPLRFDPISGRNSRLVSFIGRLVLKIEQESIIPLL